MPQRPNSPYNSDVIQAARRVADAAIRDLFSRPGSNRGVIVSAPAGAGKTGFVVEAVGATRKREMRVAVGTPTNEQAFGLVRRLAESDATQTVTFVPASTVSLPSAVSQLPNVRQLKAAQANGAEVIVGTLNKLGDAFSRGDLAEVDALFVDESYQADSAKYYAVGGLAGLHMLVGDGGQLSPFSTIDDPDFWRGLPEDPLQTAVGVLMRNHPTTPVHKLPITRRLDSRAAAVAQAFYPDLQFSAAILPDVRGLRLSPAIAIDRRGRLIDGALNRAASNGWAHLELPTAPALTADPEIIDLITGLVDRLAQRGPQIRCEIQSAWRDLPGGRIAVGVSHNDQKDILRSRLDAMGHAEIVVETANKLQGLEFELVIAWHPLAGLPDADEFHLDAGRLCVLLTRHRQACILIGRASDRELLDAIPPRLPGLSGLQSGPCLSGVGDARSSFRRDGLTPPRVKTQIARPPLRLRRRSARGLWQSWTFFQRGSPRWTQVRGCERGTPPRKCLALPRALRGERDRWCSGAAVGMVPAMGPRDREGDSWCSGKERLQPALPALEFLHFRANLFYG
jgi:hypothetical protein